MRFHDAGQQRYLRFTSFPDSEIVHAIFTRRGGVSPAPWASLNFGGTVGDSRGNVIRNHQAAFQSISLDFSSIFDAWQVHSDRVVIADAPRNGRAHCQADAIFTDRPGITLLMRFADCVPILLYDPRRRVIGLVHAGWRGTVAGIAGKAIQDLRRLFGCDPADLFAAIGPSIGPDHYPVGPEVVERVRQAYPKQADHFLRPENGQIHFDLWSASIWALREQGVEAIEPAGLCTACDLEHWYSHRGEEGRTGRFAAVIALSEGVA